MNGNKSSLVLGILALLFGIGAIYFGYKYSNEKKAAAAYIEEQAAINNQFETLTADFEQLNIEFDEVKAENIELNETLQSKIAELDAQKEKAARLIRSGGSSKLKEAKQLIAQLQSERTDLLQTIETLRAEKRALEEKNALLAADLSEEQAKNAALTADKEQLTKEKVQLTKERDEVTAERDHLKPIANYGQVIQINSVEANAVRVKKNGKEKRAKSKGADKLKVCFDLENNPVAEEGQQNYLIRILTPEGTAVYEEQNGSGVFNSLEDGKEIKYTAEANVTYNNKEKSVCWYWAQTNGYAKGIYTAEVYHRGYKVGTEQFQL